jgi:hypothetical protein
VPLEYNHLNRTLCMISRAFAINPRITPHANHANLLPGLESMFWYFAMHGFKALRQSRRAIWEDRGHETEEYLVFEGEDARMIHHFIIGLLEVCEQRTREKAEVQRIGFATPTIYFHDIAKVRTKHTLSFIKCEWQPSTGRQKMFRIFRIPPWSYSSGRQLPSERSHCLMECSQSIPKNLTSLEGSGQRITICRLRDFRPLIPSMHKHNDKRIFPLNSRLWPCRCPNYRD